MDKSVFRYFEHHWSQQVLLHHKDRSLTKQRQQFGKIFSAVRDKAMIPNNITSRFRATRTFPYNPDAILEEAFASTLVTERPTRNDLTNK